MREIVTKDLNNTSWGLKVNKNNYILLGMTVSYILVAVIQIRIDGLLPASLYVTVAFVSLEFTMLEMIKNVGFYFLYGMNRWNKMHETYVELFERSIKTYSKFNVLNEVKKEYENAIISLQNDSELSKYKKRTKAINQIISIVSCVQIIICTIQIIITPLKVIPYDQMTNKTINAIMLISFAMMYLSFFFSSIGRDYNSDLMEKHKLHEKTLTMHLDVLDKIAAKSEEK